MRASWWIGIWAAFLPSSVLSIDTTPFSAPGNVEVNKGAFKVLQLLRRSGNNCPSGYNNPCTKQGDSNACCPDGTHCTVDAANNIACCPAGASCTGVLTGTPTGAGSSFLFSQGATATTAAAGAGATITGSTVPGAYPFIYVPTTFANPETCSSYYFYCQSEYTQCTGALMGRYGVTVGGAGGAGVTVEAVTATAQATSICSSLSAKACHGLGLGYCASVPTSNAYGASGNAAVPGQTASLSDLILGLSVGIAGVFV